MLYKGVGVMVPVVIQTINRPLYLTKTLVYLELSGALDYLSCVDFHIFDCGSSGINKVQNQFLANEYGFIYHGVSENDKKTMGQGIDWISEVLNGDFIRLEDDVKVCKNWYPYCCYILKLLDGWDVVSFYGVASAKNAVPTKIPNILHKSVSDFFGLCMTAFRKDVSYAAEQANKSLAVPYEIALGREYGWKNPRFLVEQSAKGTLFVHVPSLAQHIGVSDTRILKRTADHVAPDFVGVNFDALGLPAYQMEKL